MTHCKWSRAQAGRCSLATYYELALYWQAVPPAEILLMQIANALGIQQKQSSASAKTSAQARSGQASAPKQEMTEQGLQELASAGLPVFHGPLLPHIKTLLEDLPLT